MPAWLSEYWVYIVVAAAIVVGVGIFLSRPPKKRIDIETTAAAPRRTLDRASDIGMIASVLPPVTPPSSDGHVDRDNLLIIKGTDAIYASRLDKAGYMRYEIIARWTDEQLPTIAAIIGVSVDKIRQDQWVEQAKLLAAERYDEFEARYGKMNREDLNRFKRAPQS